MEPDTVSVLRNLLGEDSFFSSFDEKEIELLAPFFDRVHIPAGTTLSEEGDDLRGGIRIVVSGEIEIRKQTEFGRQIVLAIIGRGGILGQVIKPQKPWPLPISQTARHEVELLSMEENDLKTVLENHPALGNKILLEYIRVLYVRLRNLAERLTGVF